MSRHDLILQPGRSSGAATSRAQPAQSRRGGLLGRQAAAAPTPSATGFRPVIGVVSGPIAGSVGHYNAKLYAGDIDRNATGALTAAHLGGLSAQDDARLLFLGDVGKSAHSLAAGDGFLGYASVVNDDGKLLVVSAARESGPIQAVLVKKAGGLAGGHTSTPHGPATFVYDIWPLHAATMQPAERLAISVGLVGRLGPFQLSPAPDGSIGLAVLSSGGWKLLFVSETLADVSEC